MKFCVIGLGRFGYQVATVLAENGMEVMAIDSNESIVASIRDQVTQAVCMRVTDEGSLRSLGVEEMDTVIVAMGENFAQSILVTALLKKRLKIKRVIARAINDIHKEILQLTGADQVILPEKEIGIRLADNLSSPFTELLRLSKDFSISQITAPEAFIGKTLQQLDVYHMYHVHCIGLKDADRIMPIDPEYIIQQNDKMICAGLNKQLERVAKL
ncbi:MAG: potassium channel family protein [Candidatus Babeliales bacterium]